MYLYNIMFMYMHVCLYMCIHCRYMQDIYSICVCKATLQHTDLLQRKVLYKYLLLSNNVCYMYMRCIRIDCMCILYLYVYYKYVYDT